MSYNTVIHGHYEDLNNLSTLLRNYIEVYRLLISSTAELNATSVIKKSELKHAVERIDQIGDIIDDLLKIIKKSEDSYIRYCFIKNEIIQSTTEKDKIFMELHKDLGYHNERDEEQNDSDDE